MVTQSNEKNVSSYDLIAGERRWRAAQMAKIHEVPCIVVNDVDANSASVMSLIENIQRKDLNAIEEAQGLNELINQHNYTQESAAKFVGKSRVYITNSKFKKLTLFIARYLVFKQVKNLLLKITTN